MTAAARSLAALQRKLHAAELEHLRDVVAEQQVAIEDRDAQIAELQRRVAELERDVCWADDRATMFHDALTALAADTGAALGVTQDGTVGVIA